MNPIEMVREWRKRREAIEQEKKRILRERLAKVIDEKPITNDPTHREQVERRYAEVMHAVHG